MKRDDAPVVQLTRREIVFAAMHGVTREADNIGRRQDAYGADPDDIIWQGHIEGALGEFAVSKALNLHWSGAFVFRASDVGRWQVRTTKYAAGHLIVHPPDADADRFVLVTGIAGCYRIRGWILARDAKRREWWGALKNGRPAFNVPQSALHPVVELVQGVMT